MKDRRALIALVVVGVLMVSGVAYARVINPSNENGVEGDSVTTAAPSTTPPTSSAVVGLSDWEAGLAQIIKVENDLFMAPDPSRVGEIMLTECACYADTVSRLTNLKTKGYHVDGANVVITRAQKVDEPAANQVRMVVDVKPDGKPGVDASGKEVFPSPVGYFPPEIYTIEKGQDGIWRIADRHVAKEQ